MKVHCINILLFAVPLNILVYNQRNHKSTTPHHTQTNRSLCECDIYTPVNYDNDPQMKKIMENFNKQTQQRFHEYDERMKTTRQKCKDRCDKEIEKIILKDKIEKELKDKFSTLQTDMQSDSIPTCVCENSMAEKMEKTCLKCTQNLGGIVAPSSGVLGGIGALAINAWKTTEIAAATAAAKQAGIKAGIKAGDALGMNIVKTFLKALDLQKLGIENFKSFFIKGYIMDVPNVTNIINTNLSTTCGAGAPTSSFTMCRGIRINLGLIRTYGPPPPPDEEAIANLLTEINGKATMSAAKLTETTTKEATTAAIKTNTEAIEAASTQLYNAIGYSVLAILIIVLIMVIIYLILRYRRKKKMKKKLQYIKLLEE
ncbi:rifin PIR protein,putative [Plasmodium sp. DRC-Itaito]|nr:rifin PIR protein,putative [Plasmodium sp. DRC-Itaito]